MELRILRYFLMITKTENITKAAELLHITQPTLSHHMKLLCDCGLVDYRKDGKWMHYSIAKDAHAKLAAITTEYFGEEESR